MGVKTASTGFFQIPTAPAALTAVAQSASANTLGSAVSFGNSPSAMYITGVHIGVATTQVPTYVLIQILVGGSIVGQVIVPYGVSSGVAASVLTGYRQIYPPIPVANAAAITVKSASSVASAVAWGVSLECIAQANVVDDGVAQSSNVTQWLGTAASTPATAGIPDVNVKNINNVAAATPGAAGGVLISGSNAGTTTLGALTITGATTHTGATVHTGNVSLADGLTIAAPSTGNRAGLDITGNGTGAALKLAAGATGVGLSVAGGGTSGDGIKVTTTSGHGVNLAPVGTNMHGLLSTGGNGGTSDGIKAAAGTGGVDLRAAITGNVTGNLSGSVGSVTGAVGSVTGAVGSVTGAVGSVTGTVGSVTAAVTTGAISNNAITAAAFAADAGAEIADAVWDEVLAGHLGVGAAGLALTSAGALGSPLDAAGVRSALGLASANLDTQLGGIAGYIDTEIGTLQTTATAIKGKTDSLAFTVAGKLDVNVLAVNGLVVTGSGTVAVPWGPT